MRAMGVDVSVARGLDVIVLDESGRVVTSRARLTIPGFEAILADLQPGIVAIDSPPSWASAGRSRPLERELARLGISMYATPQDPGDHEFYRWMRVGFEVFAAADRCGYPLYRGDSEMEHHAVEVFPHASAVALRGRLPGRGATKLTWRRAALDEAGVQHQALRPIDQIDAALAALTGLRCLQHRSCTVGIPGEAVLAMPVPERPRERYRREDPVEADERRDRLARTTPPPALTGGAANATSRRLKMTGEKAMEPEDVTRLVVERLNAGDAAGVAALYEPGSVLAYPADQPTTGREAIQALYQRMVDAGLKFGDETPLPTVRFEDLALTSTRSMDNTGVRVQVLRRQPDGSWQRIIDRPEVPPA